MKSYEVRLVYLCLLLPLLSVRSLDRVSVYTTLGSIQGYQNGGINYFLGIPYAEAPVGKGRFQPSNPKRPWFPTVYQATNFSNECIQSPLHSADGGPQDEDCLYLNIWTPTSSIKRNIMSGNSNSTLLPVLIWIYGGGFLHGAASRPYYWGDRLARRGVVVVSFNYRVGALGFLVSTGDGLFGNYGLFDQRLAVQWVADHIRAFGGDPNQITLFGESAGAMAITLHFLGRQQRRDDTNSNQPAFRQIILQSNPMGYKYRSVAVANFIGRAYKEQLDCEDLRCLQSEPADELLHVQDTLMAV